MVSESVWKGSSTAIRKPRERFSKELLRNGSPASGDVLVHNQDRLLRSVPIVDRPAASIDQMIVAKVAQIESRIGL